jgi:hypothetical protein
MLVAGDTTQTPGIRSVRGAHDDQAGGSGPTVEPMLPSSAVDNPTPPETGCPCRLRAQAGDKVDPSNDVQRAVAEQYGKR